MARNSYQVLGKNLDTPCNFIICYHQNSGGTMQAVRIAKHYQIPVYNLYENSIMNSILSFLKEI